jgi:hypothetical protein
MSKAGSLTVAMRVFLRASAGERVSVDEFIEKHRMARHVIEGWAEKEVFREALRKKMRGMRMLRELEVQRAAAEGARRLAQAAFGNGDFSKANLYERCACCDLVQLAMAQEKLKKERRKKRTLRRAGGGLAHPSWSDEEAEEMGRQLDELHARDRAARLASAGEAR